jgi:7,8-dihydro-6-hydroxymethylpterin dimethyltransferase
VGYSFIQVNTNGIRLATDGELAKRLFSAGLSSVFLQFDGVDDTVYQAMRNRPMVEHKIQAIRNCGNAGLGVVLVPTLVKGINTHTIGDIVRNALKFVPTVRGIHFQPVSYFGRYPGSSADYGRFTLPELMRSLEDQTDGLLKVADFSPPGGEHAHCSFHATYIRTIDGSLRPFGSGSGSNCCSGNLAEGGVRKTVQTVSRRWAAPFAAPVSGPAGVPCCDSDSLKISRVEDIIDLDTFLNAIETGSFTISAMAFQDAENIDLERLKGCCISVISPDGLLIPFCAYNLTARDGHALYRRQKHGLP